MILFDKRGMGMSDRVQAGTLEERMDDVRAVMDAVGSERAALIGESEGGPLSMLFGATFPERTAALLLCGAEVKEKKTDDWPWGESTAEEFEASMSTLWRAVESPAGVDRDVHAESRRRPGDARLVRETQDAVGVAVRRPRCSCGWRTRSTSAMSRRPFACRR